MNTSSVTYKLLTPHRTYQLPAVDKPNELYDKYANTNFV